ncbi:unnamed protein product [Cyprideis torosa]|uniref:Uncharacterized protein n=1 Tax=Cyprideis torosa TaxID=163714 RepID=A0A7R8W3J9_9CRUS|nr:unnamed protein product [Cyprideis torosa]CAG0878973.1 unnamed protein product [Cyprideis torosa]
MPNCLSSATSSSNIEPGDPISPPRPLPSPESSSPVVLCGVARTLVRLVSCVVFHILPSDVSPCASSLCHPVDSLSEPDPLTASLSKLDHSSPSEEKPCQEFDFVCGLRVSFLAKMNRDSAVNVSLGSSRSTEVLLQRGRNSGPPPPPAQMQSDSPPPPFFVSAFMKSETPPRHASPTQRILYRYPLGSISLPPLPPLPAVPHSEEDGDTPLDLSCKPSPSKKSRRDDSPGEPDSERSPRGPEAPCSSSTVSSIAKPYKRSYTPRDLEAAMLAIQSKQMGTRKAAMAFSIPRSTLRNKVAKMKTSARGWSRAHRSPSGGAAGGDLSDRETDDRESSSGEGGRGTVNGSSDEERDDWNPGEDEVKVSTSANISLSATTVIVSPVKTENPTPVLVKQENPTPLLIKQETPTPPLVSPSTSTATTPPTSGAPKKIKGSRPKRGKYRNYDQEALKKAVAAVQLGEMSVHKAGTFFGVPHSTLEYKVKERHLLRQSGSSSSGGGSGSGAGSSSTVTSSAAASLLPSPSSTSSVSSTKTEDTPQTKDKTSRDSGGGVIVSPPGLESPPSTPLPPPLLHLPWVHSRPSLAHEPSPESLLPLMLASTWQNHYRAAVVSFREDEQADPLAGLDRSYINDLRACIQACDDPASSKPAGFDKASQPP